MKRRFFFVCAVFASWIVLMALQKPIFMLYHANLIEGCGVSDWLNVVLYGLKLDAVVALYLTIIPLLCAVASIWAPWKRLETVLKIYFGVTITLAAIVFFVDLALYTFWGFRLDATLLFYIQFPGGAMASVPVWISVKQAFYSIIYIAFGLILLNRWSMRLFTLEPPVGHKLLWSVALLALAVLGFVPVKGRGGRHGLKLGSAYFSEHQVLNHAAVNSAFSLISSAVRQHDFASQFDFFPEERREEIFAGLYPAGTHDTDSLSQPLLRTQRPNNILIVILESISAGAIEPLGGEPNVTPCLNRLAGEGVLFTNIYANSFRTDRALVSLLNGYLSQPTTSLMKYPSKCRALPSLAKSFAAEGYATEMLYGGDVSYTNMHSYFIGSGYQRILSDKEFPPAIRLNTWGANDDVTFDYLLRMLRDNPIETPRFTTFLTISSHEPFVVPYQRLKDPYLNAVAFTDSCIGAFTDSLKASPVWNDMLIIFMSDHGFRYPDKLTEYEPARYHIPMIWTGGAVAGAARIETIASQSDLAATLLGAMGISAEDFVFSRNILSPTAPPFAFYTFSNGFGFIDPSGASAYDNDSNRRLAHSPDDGGRERISKGKALLQTLYDDLGNK